MGMGIEDILWDVRQTRARTDGLILDIEHMRSTSENERLSMYLELERAYERERFLFDDFLRRLKG